jgi:DNA-binding LacI/PurR family transcriptional regulator
MSFVSKNGEMRRKILGQISEIAQLAQVSNSTVSNVLNGRKNVSERLRKRVLDAAKQLDHPERSHEEAHEPKEGKVISVLFNIEGERLYSEFEQNLLRGMMTVCDKHRYYLLVKTNDFSSKKRASFPIDGEIILNPRNDELYKDSLPHVWIGTPPLKERDRIPYVDNDNELIGYSMTEYLINKGHKKIAFINSPGHKTVSHSRKRGYIQAMEDYKEITNEEPLHFFLKSEEEYYDFVYQKTIDCLKDKNGPIEAMIVNSDLMAQAVYDACEDSQKKIPDDLSVMAIYADNQSSDSFSPPLTTVELNEYQLGLESAKLLLSIIGYEKTSGGGAIVPTSIIEKESVRTIEGDLTE